jgi:valyl-tRNA synthetase
MVMLGIKLTGQLPFTEIFCHPMVRDAQGAKNVKISGKCDRSYRRDGRYITRLSPRKVTFGNLDASEIAVAKDGQRKSFPNGIPQCGTDAMRFALCAFTAGGELRWADVAEAFSLHYNLRTEHESSNPAGRRVSKVLQQALECYTFRYDEARNQLYTQRVFKCKDRPIELSGCLLSFNSFQPTGLESLVELWILDRLNLAAIGVNKELRNRNFTAATTVAYNYWLYELCDVYIVRVLSDSASRS